MHSRVCSTSSLYSEASATHSTSSAIDINKGHKSASNPVLSAGGVGSVETGPGGFLFGSAGGVGGSSSAGRGSASGNTSGSGSGTGSHSGSVGDGQMAELFSPPTQILAFSATPSKPVPIKSVTKRVGRERLMSSSAPSSASSSPVPSSSGRPAFFKHRKSNSVGSRTLFMGESICHLYSF